MRTNLDAKNCSKLTFYSENKCWTESWSCRLRGRKMWGNGEGRIPSVAFFPEPNFMEVAMKLVTVATSEKYVFGLFWCAWQTPWGLWWSPRAFECVFILPFSSLVGSTHVGGHVCIFATFLCFFTIFVQFLHKYTLTRKVPETSINYQHNTTKCKKIIIKHVQIESK